MERFSIQLGLPFLILCVASLVIAGSTMNSVWHADRALNTRVETELLRDASRLARMAERELHRSPSTIEADLTHVATDYTVSRIALIDGDGIVLMANRFAWKGVAASTVIPELDRETLLASSTRRPDIFFSPDGHTASVAMPFLTPGNGERMRGLTRGLVFIEYDLTHSRAVARADLIESRIPAISVSLLLLLLLALWLHRHVSRPLTHLAAAGRALAQGESSKQVTEAGPREIVRLARAFNNMEKQISSTHTALRESEARYRQTFDAHPLPLWIYDLDSTRILAVNDAAIHLYGYSRIEFLSMRIDDLSAEPPSDSTPQASSGPTPVTRTLLAPELALMSSPPRIMKHRLRSGQIRHVEVVSHPLEWLGHHASLVTAHDVTERLKAEDSLRLAAAAFETSEAIIITDAKGVILRLNQAFTRITGYTAEDAIGQTPALLESGKHDKTFFAGLWSALRSTGHWEGEIWNRRKDGRIYPQWLSARAVMNDRGEVTHFVANFFDLTESKAAEETIHRLSNHDALTDLPNRTLFRDRLTQAVAAARRSGQCGAVLQIDLDRFKAINDAVGHGIGDELLRQVGQRLLEALREDDTLSRLGADEYAVLLPNLPPPPERAARRAHLVAQKLLSMFDLSFEVAGEHYHLAASIGITLFPKGQEDADDLIREADTALHEAKDSGRNTVCFFESAMGAQARARFTLEAELRNAIESNELRVYLQPQTDQIGKVLAAEALVRWMHPQRGLVSPGMFIPVAEQSGLIVALGDWMLDRCCEIIARESVNSAGLRISVNVSPRQFRQTDFCARVKDILSRTGADPTRLVLEVTEGVMLDNLADTVAKMTELARLGIHFSIDDFGTGYSSLAYLKQLPIHELKVDRTFIQDAPTDPNDAAIVDSILAVARHLNLSVVAEGVETEEQANFLRKRGTMTFQGYLFGRPEPFEQFLLRYT